MHCYMNKSCFSLRKIYFPERVLYTAKYFFLINYDISAWKDESRFFIKQVSMCRCVPMFE